MTNRETRYPTRIQSPDYLPSPTRRRCQALHLASGVLFALGGLLLFDHSIIGGLAESRLIAACLTVLWTAAALLVLVRISMG